MSRNRQHKVLPIFMCKEDFMNPNWSPTSGVMNLIWGFIYDWTILPFVE